MAIQDNEPLDSGKSQTMQTRSMCSAASDLALIAAT